MSGEGAPGATARAAFGLALCALAAPVAGQVRFPDTPAAPPVPAASVPAVTPGAAEPVTGAAADPLTDPAFDAALPPLDATAPPPAPAVPPPAPADPELSAPLPPLATFDATPPPATPAQTDEGRRELVRYTADVTGLKEIGLDAQFKSLSALQKGDGKAANVSQVAQRAEEDVKLVERLLRSAGYYDGSVTQTVTPEPNQPGRARVAIAATPGPRYALGQVAITGAPPPPTALAREALGIRTGDPLVAVDVETGEARVALRLPEQGYPFAETGARDVLLDPVTHRGDYSLPITAGPRSVYGDIRVEGDPVFAADHVALLARFKRGELYDSRMVDDLRQALVGTSLLTTVSVQPVRTGTAAADGTEYADLLVNQTKGPWRTLSGQLGYATGEGIKLQGGWTHRNLFPPEGALTLSGIAGTQQQALSAVFRRSNAGRRDRTFQAGVSIERNDLAAFKANTLNINASLSRVSTPIWQKRWTYSIGGELVTSIEESYDFAAGRRTSTTYQIAALPLQRGFDSSDNLLNPTRGFRVTARVSPETSIGSGFRGYARMLLEGSSYYPVSDSLILAGRARVGSIQGTTRDSLAPSRRLYAGGGGSVRGFGFQELGPKDPDNNPLGGRGLTEFAAEARYRFGNFGIVPFLDAGTLTESGTPTLTDLRFGAGIGGRFYTNFGPFRVDVATPIGRRRGESLVALYLSIGQAF